MTRGTRNRLTEADVRTIRAECLLHVNTRTYADRYGVNIKTIRDILHGVTWGHLI